MRFLLSLFIIIYTSTIIAQTNNIPQSEILQFTSNRKVENKKLTITTTYVIRINTRIGDNNTQIAIPYSKGDKVNILEAYIQNANGEIVRKLKSNEIKDQSYISDMSLYEDDFVKTFELKHNQYPYTIVYSYKITYSKFLQISFFDFEKRKQPIRTGKLQVQIPLGDTIKYKYENISKMTCDTIDKVINYQWLFSYNPIKEEINSAPCTNTPIINVVPLNFTYGKGGSWNSWQTFGNWLHLLNENKDHLPISEMNKIDKLINGITDKKKKTKILYQYLQEYNRYINVSIGIGGLQTYPAEYVCENRYGDCKALTNYMKTILKYAGINSFYTLISMNEKVVNIDPQFAYQAFNHVILTIPFGSDTTYLECTSKNLPFGYIHSSIQGRQALLTDSKDSHLIIIPKLKAEDVLSTRSFYFSADKQVKVNATLRGEDYTYAIFLLDNGQTDYIKQYARKYIIPHFVELTDVNLIKGKRDDTFICLEANCKAKGESKIYGNNIVISPIPNSLPPYETPENRKQGLQIDYPSYQKDTIVYEFDKSIKKIPEPINYKCKYGEYYINFQIENNKLIITKSILILAGSYSIDEYKEFYSFIQIIRNNENKNIYIETI